jgi:hypothetical protein
MRTKPRGKICGYRACRVVAVNANPCAPLQLRGAANIGIERNQRMECACRMSASPQFIHTRRFRTPTRMKNNCAGPERRRQKLGDCAIQLCVAHRNENQICGGNARRQNARRDRHVGRI